MWSSGVELRNQGVAATSRRSVSVVHELRKIWAGVRISDYIDGVF